MTITSTLVRLNTKTMTKNKRYIVTMDFYIDARSDDHAISKAQMIAKRQRDQYDNQCAILTVAEHPFASIVSRQIPIE